MFVYTSVGEHLIKQVNTFIVLIIILNQRFLFNLKITDNVTVSQKFQKLYTKFQHLIFLISEVFFNCQKLLIFIFTII